MKKKLRRTLATALSVFLVAGVVLPVQANAQYAEDIPADALSYGYGGQLDLRLLENLLLGDGLSVAELNGTDQSWISGVSDKPQDPADQQLDLEALELISLNLGTLPLPLVGPGGLLEFALTEAEVGVIGEYANARTPHEAYGAVGLVGSDGSTIDLTQGGEGDTHARVNLISLLNLQQGSMFTSELISEASLELGVLGAKAERHDTGETDEALCGVMNQVDYNKLHHPDLIDQYFVISPELEASGEDDKKFCTDYRIADAKIVLDAPLIEDLMDVLELEFEGLDALINGLVNEEGDLDTVLSTVGDLLRGVFTLLNQILGILGISILDKLDLSVTASVPIADILESIAAAPLSDQSGLISIDLDAGTIEVNLQQLHGGDLSNLDPNTPLISSGQLNQIIGTVTSLLTDSAEDNQYGLMARIENAVQGNSATHTGGLYNTSVDIFLEMSGVSAGLLSFGGGTLTVSGTLGSLLNNDSASFTIEGTGTLSALNLLGGVITALASGVGGVLEELLFDGPNSIVSGLLGRVADTDLLSGLVDALSPVLNSLLQPLANAIINRQTVEKIDQGNLFTVSALEMNVLTLGGNPVTQQSENRLIGLPIATAAVLAQPRKLIDLNFDVAKIGNGRGLYTGGYIYDLACEADDWPVPEEADLEALELVYEDGNVGDGFSFTGTPGQLELIGATGGLSEPLRVAPGAQCTVTATPNQPGLGTWSALLPTGDDPTRTPYTYFLDTDTNNNVVVSGERVGEGPTDLSSDPVTIDNDRVVVEAGEVGAEWKNHSFTFVVPEDAEESHRISIAHAYDIDTRDIDLTKTVTGVAPEGETFAVEYSLDGGTTWLPQDPDAQLSPVPGGDPVTIKDVPVLDLAKLNAASPTEIHTEIKVREALGSNADAQSVTWTLDTNTLAGTYTSDGTVQYAVATFEAGPVADATVVPTPKMNVGVTNSYLEVSVDKHIDGPLDGIGATTLLPFGEDEMTIRYTVTTKEDPASVTLSDPSLINGLFNLPPNLIVEPVTGNLSGCVLTRVNGQEDTYSCEFTVTFTDPKAPFHYEAESAIVTATVTKTDGDRTITASDTDKHGAMRLSDILGQLPATGVTTLVSVLAMGLIAALGALTLYVRSRRK